MSVFQLRVVVASLLFALAALLLPSCGCGDCSDGGTPPNNTGPALGVVVPDFLLDDVNPGSTTYLASVSPRQHLTRVSAWYFGHAT